VVAQLGAGGGWSWPLRILAPTGFAASAEQRRQAVMAALFTPMQMLTRAQVTVKDVLIRASPGVSVAKATAAAAPLPSLS
jgi:hypothetical protein